MSATAWGALGYVLSGVSQLWFNASFGTIVHVFYYLGPSLLICSTARTQSPPLHLIRRAMGIACLDILAQGMHYTGASMAGPTIFAIIYSSVTIWTALLSKIFLQRRMTALQWGTIGIVVIGLSLTAWGAVQVGPAVARGTLLILFGSIGNAATYVLSEVVLHQGLTISQTAAIQGMVAVTCWQVAYATSHWQSHVAGGDIRHHRDYYITGLWIGQFNSRVDFFHTLRHVPGGATTAGILKALQAVLVFMAAHLFYCAHDAELCLSHAKLYSLVTVVSGVALFGWATAQQKQGYANIPTIEPTIEKHGFVRILNIRIIYSDMLK